MLTHIQNPYNHVPIENPDHFFNRETLTQTLMNSLFSGSVRCISLVGERKSGKTSLVKHLSHPSTIEASGFKMDHHLFVFIHCGQDRRALISQEDFYRLLLKRLYVEASLRMPDFSNNINVNVTNPDYSWQEEWGKILQELTTREFSVIIILDNFEALLKQHLLEEELFGGFHGYAAANFAWITCTFRPLPLLFEEAFNKFTIPEDIIKSESDFYNLFAHYYAVGLFEQKDIEKLISLPAATQNIRFSEQDRETILRFGGRFPYFIQQACYHFFEAYQQGEIHQEVVLQECMKDAEQIWPGYWRRLNARQKRLLYSIASNHPVKPSTETEHLKYASLVYEENGRLYPFSEEFRKFVIKREHSPMGYPVNPGERLWNQFEVETTLGQTYHSQVVKARDTLLQQGDFAIKLPYVNTNLDDQQIEQLQDMLLREVRIIRSLDHSNIGKIHDVRPNPLGIIMPWIEGQSLDKAMEQRRPFPPSDVARIGIQLTNALRYVHAHEHGIIHRDVKPKNIILTPEDKPMLIDFDVAHSENEHTLTGGVHGSPPYVGNIDYGAPEQFAPPHRVTQAADIFALGMILYELATEPGQRVFPHGSDPAAYPHGRLPIPKHCAITDPLYRILCTLLRQKPEQRPGAAKVYEALQQCLKILEGNN